MDGSAQGDRGAELQSYLASAVEHAELTYRRIERELHSGPEQHLVAAALDLRLNGSSGEAEVNRIVSELTAIVAELRAIGRDAFPAVLTEAGLGAGLRALSRRAELQVTIELTDDRRHPLPVELAVYRAVAAAISSYSAAGADRLTVTVAGEGELLVTVRPDGDRRVSVPLDDGGLDLAIWAQVAAVGGTVGVESDGDAVAAIVITIPV